VPDIHEVYMMLSRVQISANYLSRKINKAQHPNNLFFFSFAPMLHAMRQNIDVKGYTDKYWGQTRDSASRLILKSC